MKSTDRCGWQTPLMVKLRQLPLLTLAPLALMPVLLLAVLALALFVYAFRLCWSDRKGPDAMKDLADYLQRIRRGFTGGMDAQAERTRLDPLINRVKVYNTGAAISANLPLRFEFIRVYNLVSEKQLYFESGKNTEWTQLNLLMLGFHDSFYAGGIPAPAGKDAVAKLPSVV